MVDLQLESRLADALRVQSVLPSFDLAVVAGTLSELRSDTERADAVERLWAGLVEGGVLIILEDGGAVGGHVVSSARHFICTQFAATSRSADMSTWAEVLAPYTRTSVHCAVGAQGIGRREPSWLHFAQNVPNRGPNRDRRPIVSEQFSYLAVRKVGAAVPPLSICGATQPSAAKIIDGMLMSASSDDISTALEGVVKATNALETCQALAKPPYRGGDWARIIAPPQKGKRQVTLELLTPDGTVEKIVVSKRRYKCIRKYPVQVFLENIVCLTWMRRTCALQRAR